MLLPCSVVCDSLVQVQPVIVMREVLSIRGRPQFRAVFSGKEEDDTVALSFHETVLSGNIWKAICRATDREGGGCLLPEEKCTKPERLIAEVLGDKHMDMRVPPWKNLHAQPLSSMGTCPKGYPSTSRSMMSRGLHQSSPAQQVRWEQRRRSCAIGSFTLDVRPRSL